MYPSVSLLRYSIKQSISQSIVKFGIGLTMLRTPRGHLQTVCKCQLSGMSRHDSVNKSVLSRVQKVARDGTDVTSGGRQFHTWASNRKCSAANGGTVNRKLDEAVAAERVKPSATWKVDNAGERAEVRRCTVVEASCTRKATLDLTFRNTQPANADERASDLVGAKLMWD